MTVRGVPIVLPAWNDPRLRLALVISSLQVLGQVGLGFKLSVAQILISIAVCALVEVGITYRRQRALIWPASAILTGNSTAFFLRANGTHHGDWWSLNGIEFIILASLVGPLSKYFIRPGGRQMFNPSNLGLVLCLLAFGPFHVFPQYLWWGPMGPALVVALAVIIVGGFWVLWPLRMLPMVVAFLLAFIGLVGVISTSDHCFLAVWDLNPVCGSDYWFSIGSSPELLVFVLFMMSDPKTAPRLSLSRVIYGVLVAGIAAGLIAFQQSEFGIKVALLASLTVVCALVPLIDWISTLPKSYFVLKSHLRRLVGWSAVSLAATAVIAVAVPPAVISLGDNQQIISSDLSPTLSGSTNNQ